MKIGFITGEYPPMQGGVGDFTRELAQAMADLGHKPHVITNYKSPISNLPSASNLTIHHVVKNWDWRCWQAIRYIARQEKLDVLNVQYQAAAYKMHPAINFLPAARRWLGLPPIVTTFHDLKVPYLFPKAGPLREWVIQELARRSDGVIVTNYEDKSQITNLKLQIPNLEQIPIGSNIKPEPSADYVRDEWRAKWEIQRDETLVSYFGFLHPLKGGEVLIRALAQLVDEGRSAKILFIGGKTGSSDTDTNAAYAAQVEALAAELGVSERILFTGYVTPQEVTDAFYASDVTALPYLEGASLRHGTLMAALAHGRAIVTTQSNIPSPELRDGDNVLLVTPGDPKALADGLARVLDSPALRERLEQGAAKLAQQFTWDTIATRTIEIYQCAMQAKQPGGSMP